MHTYLRSVGFKGYSRQDMKKFIDAQLKKAVDNKNIVYSEENKKAFARLACAYSMGISVVADCKPGGELDVEHFMPYLIADTVTDVQSIYADKHSFDDSYGMMTDDIKTNATIVCTFENAYCYKVKPNETSKIDDVKVALSGFCTKGTVLFPISSEASYKENMLKRQHRRNNWVAAAKDGSEEAIEKLALEDIDTYNMVMERIKREDLYSIVESTFIPCGVECDTYSILGEIISVKKEVNAFTLEVVINMEIECNGIRMNVAVNKEDLVGEPAVGRRFKGHIWLAGRVLD